MLGVFGLDPYTDERRLRSVFGAYGDIDKLVVVKDRQVRPDPIGGGGGGGGGVSHCNAHIILHDYS